VVSRCLTNVVFPLLAGPRRRITSLSGMAPNFEGQNGTLALGVKSMRTGVRWLGDFKEPFLDGSREIRSKNKGIHPHLYSVPDLKGGKRHDCRNMLSHDYSVWL